MRLGVAREARWIVAERGEDVLFVDRFLLIDGMVGRYVLDELFFCFVHDASFDGAAGALSASW